jgi:hypothetical protein
MRKIIIICGIILLTGCSKKTIILEQRLGYYDNSTIWQYRDLNNNVGKARIPNLKFESGDTIYNYKFPFWKK